MSLPEYNPLEEEKAIIAKKTSNIQLKIGIHSGKGGVGKTFLAVQTALILADKGLKVGLLDADIDCPNIPEAINRQENILVKNTKLKPVDYQGIKVISSGFIQQEGEPLLIRGPIKHRVLTDFLTKTDWGELDALVIDFPPGTSDIPLSAMQIANLTGVIIISTPQRGAVQDAMRAIRMAKKLNTKIIGLIENMSGDIFGTGAIKELAGQEEVDFLLSIPLRKEIREQAEEGKIVIEPEEARILYDKIRSSR